MLRIHFSAGDLGRTRVASQPDPMWELVLSMHLLQKREGAIAFRGWRQQVQPRLGPWLKPLFGLNPGIGYFPDFLTPPEGGVQVGHGVDAVARTPRARLRADIAKLSRQQALSGWMRGLADGDARALRQLGKVLHAYHDAAVAPVWRTVQTHVEADRAVRARAFLDGGTEGLLRSLRPVMRWNSPVLEVAYPFDQDLHLDGRGLMLIPSYFCWRMPVTLVDSELPPVLVYPVEHDQPDPDDAAAPEVAERRLAALLGTTRAAILRAVGIGATTTELGQRAGVSTASASQHATVLREAGLLATRRFGGSALHSLTPLGAALLAEETPGPAAPRAAGPAAPSSHLLASN